MALILEARDIRGVATLHRLNGTSFTIGRALTNDIILDDLYADARHATITANEAGALELVDNGSVNGILVNGARSNTPVALQAGVEVRIGRTTLRFRDVDEVVAPALVDLLVVAPNVARSLLWLPEGTKGQWAIILSVTAFTSFNAWLGLTDKSNRTAVFAAALVTFVLMVVWSGFWAVFTRGLNKQFRMLRHLTVASVGVFAFTASSMLGEWGQFLFPDVKILLATYAVLGVVVFAFWTSEHLIVPGFISARRIRQWKIGALVGAGVIGGIGAAIRDTDKFSNDAKLVSSIKPLNDRIVPTMSVGDFSKETESLKEDADKVLAK